MGSGAKPAIRSGSARSLGWKSCAWAARGKASGVQLAARYASTSDTACSPPPAREQPITYVSWRLAEPWGGSGQPQPSVWGILGRPESRRLGQARDGRRVRFVECRWAWDGPRPVAEAMEPMGTAVQKINPSLSRELPQSLRLGRVEGRQERRPASVDAYPTKARDLPSKPVLPQTEGWGCPKQASPKKQGCPRKQDSSRTTKEAPVEAAFQARIPPNRRLGLPRTSVAQKARLSLHNRTRPGPPRTPQSKLPSRPVFSQTEGWGCPEQASPKKQGCPCKQDPSRTTKEAPVEAAF